MRTQFIRRCDSLGDELAQDSFRLGTRQPVQIDFCVDRVVTPAQFDQHILWRVRAPKERCRRPSLWTHRMIGRRPQAFPEHFALIEPRKASLSGRLRRRRRRLRCTERLLTSRIASRNSSSSSSDASWQITVAKLLELVFDGVDQKATSQRFQYSLPPRAAGAAAATGGSSSCR